MNEGKTVIVYHKHCIDGFGAAWSAWKKFGDTAEYIGLTREDAVPDFTNVENLYFIDFTYPAPITKKIVHANKHVCILDHHISEKDAVALAHEPIFDNDRSGAMIAWQYFHTEEKIPELIKYIQDNDLFTRKLPHISEMIAALSLEPHDFKRFSELADTLETSEGRVAYIKKGKTLVQAEERAVQKLLSYADEVIFEGYRTKAVNTILFYSQTAASMYLELGFPLGLAWSYRGKNKIHVSLRSDGKVDCASLAKKYGGGGHKGAAGFIIDFDGSFPWKRLDG